MIEQLLRLSVQQRAISRWEVDRKCFAGECIPHSHLSQERQDELYKNFSGWGGLSGATFSRSWNEVDQHLLETKEHLGTHCDRIDRWVDRFCQRPDNMCGSEFSQYNQVCLHELALRILRH